MNYFKLIFNASVLIHLLDLIDELKEAGLDDEEAFWVASKRMGNGLDLEVVYSEANNALIQMRKSIVILAGILIYFLLYYFLLFSSKLLLILLLYFETDEHAAIRYFTIYLEASHFLFIFFVISIYFLEIRTITFIKNINIKPIHTFFLLFTTIVFSVVDTCLLPITKNMIRKGVPIGNQFYDTYLYFSYSFPLMICVCFVFLFITYFKKSQL